MPLTNRFSARCVLLCLAAALSGCGGCKDDPPLVPDVGDDPDGISFPDVDADIFIAPDVDAFDEDVDAAPDADTELMPDTDAEGDADADADGGMDADADTGTDIGVDSTPDTPETRCGDGNVDDSETCDDGNVVDGDGCASDCTEERCGDGRVTPELGEACEPGLTAPSCATLGLAGGDAGCTEACALDLSGCRVPTCGDGVVDEGEVCDDGGRAAGDGCDPWCRTERCLRGGDSDGDGIDDCDDVEVCDGLDNDGDGLIDDHPTDVVLGAPCYDVGTEAQANVGACTFGALACVDGALACIGDVAPRPELCNAVDDDCDGTAPDAEATAGCLAVGTAGTSTVATVEVQLRRPAVDTALIVDRTASMGGVLDGLASAIALGALPADDAAGLGTFADLDLPDVGAPLVDAWRLERRIAWDVDGVVDRLRAVPIADGGDRPEAGLVALAHVATGGAVTWDAGTAPTATPALLARRDDGDVDEYQVSLDAGDALYVEVTARRDRSQLDPVLTLLDASGAAIARNDDTFGLDPAVRITANRAGTYTVRVSACCDADEPWGDTTGWYTLRVLRNDRPLLPAFEAGSCTRVESDEAVELVEIATAWPYDASRCAAECAAAGAPAARVDGFCGDGSPWSVCGDGVVGWGEACDGPGCSDDCRPSGAIAAFDARVGFVAAAGHGTIGGVGFRDRAAHHVLHVTDAPWHDPAEYAGLAAVSGLLDLAETVAALDAAGIVVSSLYAGAPGDMGWPQLEAMARATGAEVPACAFDGSRPLGCEPDACCIGAAGAGWPADASGVCPLIHAVSADGADVDDVMARRAAALPRVPVTADVTVARGDLPECAQLFVSIDDVVTPTCAATPAVVELDDGTLFVDDLDLDAVVTLRITLDASTCEATAAGNGTVVLTARGSGAPPELVPVTLVAAP